MVQGQPVVVDKKTRDRYQRIVGTVYRASDDSNVNREQTCLGNSWAYRTYLCASLMLALEDVARSSKMGLWGLAGEAPLSPWQWRREPLKLRSNAHPLSANKKQYYSIF